MDLFEVLGFNLVGYGCIMCIGNFGLLFDVIIDVIRKVKFMVILVLFGNCNFEGCIYFDVVVNYFVLLLLVVVYVLVGNMNVDIIKELLG